MNVVMTHLDKIQLSSSSNFVTVASKRTDLSNAIYRNLLPCVRWTLFTFDNSQAFIYTDQTCLCLDRDFAWYMFQDKRTIIRTYIAIGYVNAV